VRSGPSFTAAFVAACRGAAHVLPPEARLVDDPWGRRVPGPGALLARHPGPLARWQRAFVLYMQVRTRALDDVVTGCLAEEPDTQLVLLGAGYDCRAARLPVRATFEVDHPATQAHKRALLGERSAAVYVPYDFERPTASLSQALLDAGFDPARPSVTLWEGVTMYLSAAAVDDTVRAVATYAAPGSVLAFNYLDARALAAPPRLFHRLVKQVVSLVGEPFTFGFTPEALPAWLSERGFARAGDQTLDELAAGLLPPRFHGALDAMERRICVARRLAG
jgi:methyltransferase (TIGR00027 family)